MPRPVRAAHPVQAVLIALSLVLPVLSASGQDAQPSGAGPETPGAQPETEQVSLAEYLEQVEQADPTRRAGLRADIIRRTQQVVPSVVIVEDARGFLGAIGAWEGTRRFPILWDDGSVSAGEDIARFVRAFQPEAVYRFTPGDEAPAWPGPRAEREAAFRAALARTGEEGSADFTAVLNSLREQGVVSPGIVVTDVDDPAWPAALALAAARFQPVALIDNPTTSNAALTAAQGDLFEDAAENLARSTGLTWREQGDDIDAIALCLNAPVKVSHGPGHSDVYATSARVGRFGPDGTGARWANTGQVFGSYGRALYQAMCALFLSPREAFIFDGYDDTAPWNAYDGTKAAELLESAGWETQLHDLPSNTPDHWMALTARPLRPGLILINTHGQQGVINLRGGKVRAADTPMLDRPAIAHVVHSFAMATPTNRYTVAGALLDRGVYAMLGSVDEPYLQAFVPTPVVAARLLAGFNFAAAVRFDDVPVWKLGVLGDPLITLGPAGTRLEDAGLTLPGELTDLETDLAGSLKDRDLARAADILTTLGRDRDAARLASAAMDSDRLTPALAAAALPALFRDSRHDKVLTVYAALSEEDRADPILADCFWFAGRFVLTSAFDRERAEGLMVLFQRPGSKVADAVEIAERLRRRSLEEAVVFLESVRSGLTSRWEFDALDDALTRLRAGGS